MKIIVLPFNNLPLMKKIVFFTAVLISAELISLNARAQQNDNPIQFFTPEKANALSNSSPITVLSLHDNTKAEKIGTNKLFDYYRLPLDGMICIVPNNEIKYHINLYNPPSAANNYTDNIPNALPKIGLIK